MILPALVLSSAALIAGKPVPVSCRMPQNVATWSAVTVYAEQRIYMRPWICRELRNFVRHPVISRKAAWSIATLAHEAEHIADPDASERVIECRGLERVSWLSQKLGASKSGGDSNRSTARILVRALLPAAYQSSCTRGAA